MLYPLSYERWCRNSLRHATGNEGIGKPEPLKHGFHGYWSCRITDEHRLIYKVSEDEVGIAACRYHYGS